MVDTFSCLSDSCLALLVSLCVVPIGGASSAPKVKELWVLKYDYVPDILTKREPHRSDRDM
jgi:hypothetical protein